MGAFFDDVTVLFQPGHSHWKDSLFYGRGLDNVTIRGAGSISGNGALDQGEPQQKGDGCRMFGIVSSSNIALYDLHLKQGGWFTGLFTNITGLIIDGVTAVAARDCFDIISSRHVLVQNVDISGGGDDALVLKSDVSTGKVIPSYNITVKNSRIGSNGCNALNFGSETAGDFSDVTWSNITVTGAGKAGIGIISMDGSHVSNVVYKDITMSEVVTPFYMYIGARMRRPGGNVTNLPGSITNITITNVRVTNVHGGKGIRNWTSTFDGMPVDLAFNVKTVHPVGPGIVLDAVSMEYKGGGNGADVAKVPPHPADKYPPRYLGVRPSFGFFVRNSVGITFNNMQLTAEQPDSRPAIIVNSSSGIKLSGGCTAMRGTGQAWDVGVGSGCSNIDTAQSPALVVKHL